MERKKFLEKFSIRLTHLMRKEGYETNRAKTGVDIQKLAKVTGCSYQMARKYTLGLALPELHVVVKIAAWLNTSPSWLLFGEKDPLRPKLEAATQIEIEPDLLKYILTKSIILFSLTENTESVVNFIIDTIYDASHIDADTRTIHKIIDMMLTSVTLLHAPVKDKKQLCAS